MKTILEYLLLTLLCGGDFWAICYILIQVFQLPDSRRLLGYYRRHQYKKRRRKFILLILALLALNLWAFGQ